MSDILTYVKSAVKALDDRLAQDITVIQISKVTTIADYFVIASASNPNQMEALRDAVDEALGKMELNPKRVEGGNTSAWVLMDYGDFVVHIFTENGRGFYNIERIWADGEVIDIETLLA